MGEKTMKFLTNIPIKDCEVVTSKLDSCNKEYELRDKAKNTEGDFLVNFKALYSNDEEVRILAIDVLGS